MSKKNPPQKNNNINKDNDNSLGQEEVYEITAIAFASVMILISALVIYTNIRLSRRLDSRRKHPSVKKLRKMLIKGRTAVKTGHLTAQETVILALEAGMTMEDVRLEYVSANGTREEVLEGVFGKKCGDEKFLTKLKASGRFMESGYANEAVFLDLWKAESYRDLVAMQQREECRTQSYQLPPPEEPTAAGKVENEKGNRSPTTQTTINNKISQSTGSLDSKTPKSDGGGKSTTTKSIRKRTIDMKMLSCVPGEGKPLLCGPNDNDDAQ